MAINNDHKTYDYSGLKNAADVQEALKRIQAEAGKNKGVKKEQIEALTDKVEELGLIDIKFTKGSQTDTMGGGLSILAGTASDSSAPGNPLTDAFWKSNLDGMITEMGNDADIAFQKAGGVGATPSSGSSAGIGATATAGVSTQGNFTLEQLKQNAQAHKPPYNDNPNDPKERRTLTDYAVMQFQKTLEMQNPAATPEQISKSMSDVYTAYNGDIGDNGTRHNRGTTEDFVGRLSNALDKSSRATQVAAAQNAVLNESTEGGGGMTKQELGRIRDEINTRFPYDHAASKSA